MVWDPPGLRGALGVLVYHPTLRSGSPRSDPSRLARIAWNYTGEEDPHGTGLGDLTGRTILLYNPVGVQVPCGPLPERVLMSFDCGVVDMIYV